MEVVRCSRCIMVVHLVQPVRSLSEIQMGPEV